MLLGLDDTITCNGYTDSVYSIHELTFIIFSWETLAYRSPKHIISSYDHSQIIITSNALHLFIDQRVVMLVRSQRAHVVVLRPVWIKVHLNCSHTIQMMIKSCLGNIRLGCLYRRRICHATVLISLHVKWSSQIVVGYIRLFMTNNIVVEWIDRNGSRSRKNLHWNFIPNFGPCKVLSPNLFKEGTLFYRLGWAVAGSVLPKPLC
mmetsp:Transcript_13491/g.27382  ORF Transcript_13491/g.27382 Transcript_13491/m.27382 type:complete len:205 (-) Transcript_13491:746-1360(-)